MDWKEVGAKIAKSAPLIGGILGGPGGGAIGGVVSMVASALGLKSESPAPEEVMRAIEQNPDALLKLKEMELRNKTTLEDMALKRDIAYLEDRQDARRRQTGHEEATGKSDINLYVMGWVTIGGFFGCLIITLVFDIPEGEVAKTVISMLFGAMIGGYKDVLGYFFGSSKSSAEKTKALANK
jgi:hypothetical protein